MYILTKEEYDELKVGSENEFLRQHRDELSIKVKQLTAELEKYKMFKRDMELTSDKLASEVGFSTADIPRLYDEHKHKFTTKTALYEHIGKLVGKSKSYVRNKVITSL